MKILYFSILLFILSGCNPNSTTLNGYVEAEYKYVAPTSSGILKSLYVEKGGFVKLDDKLFELEDTDLKVAIENAKTQILEAEALLKEDLKSYARAQKLVQNNTVSQSDFEKQEANYLVSKAKLEIAKQNLIATEKKLNDSAPIATGEFYVENTFFMPGEFVPAGKPVVSLFSPKDLKIRFFIPQSDLAKVKSMQKIMISCDGCKEKISGKISYIASKAEYTPPVIYSKDARQKMVFLAEAIPDEESSCLHPGLPVDVEIKD